MSFACLIVSEHTQATRNRYPHSTPIRLRTPHPSPHIEPPTLLMLRSSREQRRKDRLSVSIIPSQNLRTNIPSPPCLNILFQKSEQFRRIHEPDEAAEVNSQDATMAEVLDFLEQQECDTPWLPPRKPYEVSVLSIVE